MQIGIIGAGHMGATVARLLARAGHQIHLSNSRGPDSLVHLVKELGPGVRAAPVGVAAHCSEVVFLAIPWIRLRTLWDRFLFADRILVDTTNPYSERFEVVDMGESTSSEIVARHFPNARVVKAFNTLYWETLATRGTKHTVHRLTVPLASDDLEAKACVSGLISDCGFAPFDVGTLRKGGTLQQPEKLLFNRTLTLREARKLLEDAQFPSGA